jgi:hypothetical protein
MTLTMYAFTFFETAAVPIENKVNDFSKPFGCENGISISDPSLPWITGAAKPGSDFCGQHPDMTFHFCKCEFF